MVLYRGNMEVKKVFDVTDICKDIHKGAMDVA